MQSQETLSGSESESEHAKELRAGRRFAFGSNWAAFLATLDEPRIRLAEESLRIMLGIENLTGKTFLDAGSGSGLFSLAARNLGARVRSFDYDPASVACTAELKRRFYPHDAEWVVEEGSVLDTEFLAGLGQFDIVYSWGVLHHTGAMWPALANITGRTAEEGKLFVALYNDQGRTSRWWLTVKKSYNALPSMLRWLVLFPAFIRMWGPTFLRDTLRGVPLRTWRDYPNIGARGMSAWRDVVDWVGGLPFEVAKPEEVFDFIRDRNFVLERLKTCAGGYGCNEFVFKLARPA